MTTLSPEAQAQKVVEFLNSSKDSIEFADRLKMLTPDDKPTVAKAYTLLPTV